MKAVVFGGPRNMIFEEVPKPVVGAGEVLATVEAVGVCGSEIEAYVGTSTKRVPPLIFGHEMAVTVPGTAGTFVVNPLRSCEECTSCHSGDTNLCGNRSLMSLHRDGGLAERVVVRMKDLILVSKNVSATEAALVEPAATALHALDVPGGVAGKSVLVIGCGALGLLAIQIAVAEGAREVVASEVVQSRLELAATYGARTLEQVGEDYRADVVVDAVGSDATRRIAVRYCLPGGRVRLVGLRTSETSLPMNEIISRGLQLQGIYAYRQEHIERVVALLDAGHLDFGSLVTLKSLHEAPEVFEVLANDAGTWIKVVLQP